ncbi:MAG TPA: DUF5684 domain-containing protein [Verrucomicrobiae bacterium]|nr:DUF5684 domain-containing protein [Verrucomicrobiae bacterium]
MPCTTWAQEALDSLATYDGLTFSNVTLTSQTKTHISFKHADGFASVKLSMLPPEEQAKIGYTPPPPPKSLLDYTKDVTAGMTKNLAQWLNDPRLQALTQEVRAEVNRVFTENDKVILYSVIGGVACIYLLFSLAAVKICRKTTVRPGLWVWLPGLEWISLLKAAGMSPWNFIWLLIPPINLIVMAVWCFKICRMRHKSSALGFLLLIPVINILAYFYLAFSEQKYPASHAHA